MKVKHNIFIKISLSTGVAAALALTAWTSGSVDAADHPADHQKGAHDMTQMQQIKTQAQAEALKPGDSMSMTCIKCKSTTVQQVTADMAHVKMMTVGEKVMCPSCDGTVEIVATGKGEGKEAEVNHVCSKCGDDAMFCAATKPGSGSMNDMPMEKK